MPVLFAIILVTDWLVSLEDMRSGELTAGSLVYLCGK